MTGNSQVCEALVEFAVSMRWFSTAARAVKLCQGIKGRAWEDDKSGRLLRQLKGVGDSTSKKLVSASVVNLNDMSKLSVPKLEAIVGKQLSAKVFEELSKVPSYQIDTELDSPKPNSFDVRIKLRIRSTHSPETPGYLLFPVLLVGKQDGDCNLIEHKVIGFVQSSNAEVSVRVKQERKQQQVFIHVMNKNFVGRDGNAIVLIPGSIDLPDADDSPVTTKKLRKTSTAHALPSEFQAEAYGDNSKLAAHGCPSGKPAQKLASSSSQAMLSILGARAGDPSSSSTSTSSLREANVVNDGRMKAATSATPRPAGPSSQGKQLVHSFWSARSQASKLSGPKSEKASASASWLEKSTATAASKNVSSRYVLCLLDHAWECP